MNTAQKNYAITFLRVLATSLITCTHLNDVLGKFAVGGLLGDVLFFFISGYCYGKGISKNFGDWYVLRWQKLYPPVLVMVVLNFTFGLWPFPIARLCDITLFSIFPLFLFPTNFVFFGAIIVLYIPLFFYVNLKNKYRFIFLGLTTAAFAAYFSFLVDHHIYSMNNTGNVTILFVYLLAAFLGAESFHLKEKITGVSIFLKSVLIVISIACGGLYFYFTLFFRRPANAEWLYGQILVPISLLAFCTLFANSILAFEKLIRQFSPKLIAFLDGIADLTLEIYVVQLLIIKHLSGLPFPFNLLLILPAIILAAWCLKKICAATVAAFYSVFEKINNKTSRTIL